MTIAADRVSIALRQSVKHLDHSIRQKADVRPQHAINECGASAQVTANQRDLRGTSGAPYSSAPCPQTWSQPLQYRGSTSVQLQVGARTNSDVRALTRSQTACFSLDAQNLGGIQRHCLKRLLWRQSLCGRHDFAQSIHRLTATHIFKSGWAGAIVKSLCSAVTRPSLVPFLAVPSMRRAHSPRTFQRISMIVRAGNTHSLTQRHQGFAQANCSGVAYPMCSR